MRRRSAVALGSPLNRGARASGCGVEIAFDSMEPFRSCYRDTHSRIEAAIAIDRWWLDCPSGSLSCRSPSVQSSGPAVRFDKCAAFVCARPASEADTQNLQAAGFSCASFGLCDSCLLRTGPQLGTFIVPCNLHCPIRTPCCRALHAGYTHSRGPVQEQVSSVPR